MKAGLSLIIIAIFIICVSAVEPPPGLRPAKKVGDEERKVLPLAEKSKDEPIAPPNVRTPPNLSLRSRMIAAQNSAAASHDEPTEFRDSSQQQPVIFTKAPKVKPVKSSPAQIKKTVIIPAESEVKIPRVTGPTPNKGHYGVNTVLQTNLVDSQGRVIKGVSSVPIPLPSTGEIKSKGQATASEVGNDEDRVVPVKFGRAGDN